MCHVNQTYSTIAPKQKLVSELSVMKLEEAPVICVCVFEIVFFLSRTTAGSRHPFVYIPISSISRKEMNRLWAKHKIEVMFD